MRDRSDNPPQRGPRARDRNRPDGGTHRDRAWDARCPCNAQARNHRRPAPAPALPQASPAHGSRTCGFWVRANERTSPPQERLGLWLRRPPLARRQYLLCSLEQQVQVVGQLLATARGEGGVARAAEGVRTVAAADPGEA